MTTPEKSQGGEPENLWDELLGKRLTKKAELLAANPNMKPRELSRALWDVGFEETSDVDTVRLHKGSHLEPDTDFMTKDAFELEAIKPVFSEEDADIIMPEALTNILAEHQRNQQQDAADLSGYDPDPGK